MKRTDLQNIMSRAWQIKRQYDIMFNGQTLFAECLRMAWAEVYKTDRLVEKMREGAQWFTFEKVDGTIRRACGTLNPALMPENESENRESNRRQNESIQVYYDLEKQAFRCFKKANLLSIDND